MSANDMYLNHLHANWWHAARMPLRPAILAPKLATWCCTCISCSMQGSGAMVTHGKGFTHTFPVCQCTGKSSFALAKPPKTARDSWLTLSIVAT